MSSFTFGWAFWYACAAGTRVESTHTTSGPEVCAACVKPSFAPAPETEPLAEELPFPHAATVTTSATAPTANAARALDALRPLRARAAGIPRAIDASTTLCSRLSAATTGGQQRSIYVYYLFGRVAPVNAELRAPCMPINAHED